MTSAFDMSRFRIWFQVFPEVFLDGAMFTDKVMSVPCSPTDVPGQSIYEVIRGGRNWDVWAGTMIPVYLLRIVLLLVPQAAFLAMTTTKISPHSTHTTLY